MSIIKVRASSWGRLFDCAYAWQGVNLENMRSPGSPRSLLGTAIHAGTAAFDLARMNGDEISIVDAAGVTVDALRQDEDVSWAGSDITRQQAESVALSLVSRYCRDVSPRFEFVAVELTTKPLVIDCGGGQFIELTGTLDRSRFSKATMGVKLGDVKTGKTAVKDGVASTKGHRPQLGAYSLLFEHTTGNQVDDEAEIIGMKTSGKPEIATGTTTGSKALMLGDEQNKGLIAIASDMFRAGLFPPNPQSRLCGPKYCPRWATCKYHD